MGFEGQGLNFNATHAIGLVCDDKKSCLCGGFTPCQEFYLNSSQSACTATLIYTRVEEVEGMKS